MLLRRRLDDDDDDIALRFVIFLSLIGEKRFDSRHQKRRGIVVVMMRDLGRVANSEKRERFFTIVYLET